MTDDDRAEVLRLEDGPYDGGCFDRDLFGGRLPNVLCIPAQGRCSRYALDIDAEGPCYRFAGWQPRTTAESDWELLRAWTERVREESRALAAESSHRISRFNQIIGRESDWRSDLWANRRRKGDAAADRSLRELRERVERTVAESLALVAVGRDRVAQSRRLVAKWQDSRRSEPTAPPD